ncbi:MAG: hypothetical protein H7196_01680 [candidate division SR1 bacterium]|nr:hypothetical protein [candidate division SR1 bacterium]
MSIVVINDDINEIALYATTVTIKPIIAYGRVVKALLYWASLPFETIMRTPPITINNMASAADIYVRMRANAMIVFARESELVPLSVLVPTKQLSLSIPPGPHGSRGLAPGTKVGIKSEIIPPITIDHRIIFLILLIRGKVVCICFVSIISKLRVVVK